MPPPSTISLRDLGPRVRLNLLELAAHDVDRIDAHPLLEDGAVDAAKIDGVLEGGIHEY